MEIFSPCASVTVLRLAFSHIFWDFRGAQCLSIPSSPTSLSMARDNCTPGSLRDFTASCSSLFRQTYTHLVTHVPVFTSELSANTNLMRINFQFLTTVRSAINYVSTGGTTVWLSAHHINAGQNGRGAERRGQPLLERTKSVRNRCSQDSAVRLYPESSTSLSVTVCYTVPLVNTDSGF